ncbi:MAG: hypothetical protein P9L97_02320 [Candidatus Tenebribacter davisii]|nr:hypothetical protein [Candidatus Tenebribacter davisii]
MNIGFKTIGILMISFIIISCTQRNNVVGTNGPGGATPLITIIENSNFTDFYSFEDSCAYSNSTTMLMGKYQNETAYSLLRFTVLPDTFYEISSVNISLEIKNRHNFDDIDNTTFKLAKINDINWYENANWWISSDSTSWNNGEYFSIDDYTDLLQDEYEVECNEDSININLDINILENWIDDEDNVNSGLVIYSNTDGFMEIYTSEYSNDKNPILTFEYKESETDTLTTESISTCYDCMIYETDNNYEYWQDELKISNIQPISIFTKFNIQESIFTDMLPDDYIIENADTNLFLQRITINRAELIFNSDGINAFPIDGSISLIPYFVIGDTLNFGNSEIPLLTDDDIDDLYISSSSDTLQSEKYTINITRMIQYYISGEYENKGLVIRSLNTDNNFIHTEFDLEPVIEITFTPPYIEE